MSLCFCLAAQAVSVEEAMRLYSGGKQAEARQMLGHLVKAEPANFEAHYNLGLIALDSGELQLASSSLEKATQLRSFLPQVWLALAQSYLKLEKKKAAADAASKAEGLAGEDAVISHGLAYIHSQLGNWIKAAQFEGRYASKTPADRDALARAASFYLQGGQPKPAIELTQKALAQQERADLRNLLGKAYEADGQFEKTIIELQQAIKLAPHEESFYFDLVHVLLRHQNFDVAIQVAEAAKKRFPKSAQLELTLGIAHYGQRRFAEAVDAFLRTTEMAPEVEQPYVFLGRILNHAETRLDEVIERFANFAKANPENFMAQFLHAKALIASMGPSVSGESVREAEGLLRKSIGLKQDFWESHFELGVLLEQQREYSQAAEHLKRSSELNPKSPAPHYRLARVYDRLGQAQMAQAERDLHERLSAEERAAIEKQAAETKRLELKVQ